ncbi:DUF3788 family protein [Paenibacillus lentus]|uniref:DUF3788 family protein n=1 Tax=Paenibacillus lentus TaxID=1338368 RepID=UPI003661CB9F
MVLLLIPLLKAIQIYRNRSNRTEEVRNIYDATAVYHDGNWVMLEVSDGYLVDDIKKMIWIKKKPNKKQK